MSGDEAEVDVGMGMFSIRDREEDDVLPSDEEREKPGSALQRFKKKLLKRDVEKEPREPTQDPAAESGAGSGAPTTRAPSGLDPGASHLSPGLSGEGSEKPIIKQEEVDEIPFQDPMQENLVYQPQSPEVPKLRLVSPTTIGLNRGPGAAPPPPPGAQPGGAHQPLPGPPILDGVLLPSAPPAPGESANVHPGPAPPRGAPAEEIDPHWHARRMAEIAELDQQKAVYARQVAAFADMSRQRAAMEQQIAREQQDMLEQQEFMEDQL
ncbi:MAG: hypothetical protein GY830_06075, partial [Bacteroidetes bacterium]|nr:hypothetical protein [Bacteroidota bacterium]